MLLTHLILPQSEEAPTIIYHLFNDNEIKTKEVNQLNNHTTIN